VKQLVLEISPPPAPDFANYVAGRNAEAVAVLRGIVDNATAASGPIKVVYLWGAAGSGKTHLLRAFARRFTAEPTHTAAPLWVVSTASGSHVLVDNAERLNDDQQVALFNAINERSLERGSTVVVTGAVSPRDLALRPELSSRLGSGLVFALHPLSDDEKRTALRAHASSRGFALRDDVIAYMLRYAKRDMPSQIAILDALDRYSLETGREITLPLLKQMGGLNLSMDALH
jgi:DnaA family protein